MYNEFYLDVMRARIIYTHNNHPIDFFIKNQNDLYYGEFLKNSENLPILVRKTFVNIYTLYQDNNLNLVQIYKEFYCVTEWSNDCEKELIEYKVYLFLVRNKLMLGIGQNSTKLKKSRHLFSSSLIGLKILLIV